MRNRTLTAALTAAAMVCTSAPSFAQAAPEPAATVEQGLELAHDGTEHRSRRGTMWAVAGFIVIVVGVLLLFGDSDDNDEPVSP